MQIVKNARDFVQDPYVTFHYMISKNHDLNLNHDVGVSYAVHAVHVHWDGL